MANEYTVDSFDDIDVLNDYISIVIDGKWGGYDSQRGYEGVLLSKSYHRDYFGKMSSRVFDITLAAYDAFADICYGPIKLNNIAVGPAYKSCVTVNVLDQSDPEIKERFNKVSEWLAKQ